MPKLLIFAPCEKVIVDEQNNPTLIVLLQNISAGSVTDEPIPANAVTPKEWAVFSLWQPMPEDNGKKVSQVLQVVYPDGKIFATSNIEFTLIDREHRNTAKIIGFPVGQAGTYLLKMWLESSGKKITEEFVYPLTVAHDLGRG